MCVRLVLRECRRRSHESGSTCEQRDDDETTHAPSYRVLDFFLKYTPDFSDFLAKLDSILDLNISQIAQDERRIAVREIHFHHAGDFDFLARWQFESSVIRLGAAGDARNKYG